MVGRGFAKLAANNTFYGLDILMKLSSPYRNNDGAFLATSTGVAADLGLTVGDFPDADWLTPPPPGYLSHL